MPHAGKLLEHGEDTRLGRHGTAVMLKRRARSSEEPQGCREPVNRAYSKTGRTVAIPRLGLGTLNLRFKSDQPVRSPET